MKIPKRSFPSRLSVGNTNQWPPSSN